MRLLDFDPGSRNYAYSILDIQSDDFEYIEIGMIDSTIVNLTPNPIYKKPKTKKKIPKIQWPNDPPIAETFPKFVKVINDLIDEFSIDEIVVERFQSRGLKGSTIEAVSIMIGIILHIAHKKKVKVRLITAAQWKNMINKHIDLEALYKQTHSLGLTPHETDASCMGIYHNHTHYAGSMEWSTKIFSRIQTYVKTI